MKNLLRIAIPLLAVLTVASSGLARPKRHGAATRPNVLVVMTDDQTIYELWAMRNVERYMVHGGTTFDNMFATFPLCCPSRATFLTGQYSHNTGVVGNNAALGYDRFDQSRTLAVWLKRAGYHTIMVGKYLNGYLRRAPRYVPPGWDDWHAALKLAYLGYTMNDNGTVHAYGTKRSNYQTDVFTQKALAAIRAAPKRRPFFMWLSYFAPHYGGPTDPDDPPGLLTPSPPWRFRDRFQRTLLPVTPSFNERDVSDKPADIRRRPLLTTAKISAIREEYEQRLESLLAVDEGFGKIVSLLRKRGQLGRTLILFTSDNGYVFGQHRLFSGKVFPYEPAIRVPLLMRGPGVPANVHLSQLVGNIDMAPTIVDSARAHPDLTQDGRSLWPLLRDRGLEWGRDIVIERGPGERLFGPSKFIGVRTPRFAYFQYSTGEKELYDLDADPDELQNEAGSPEYHTVESELAKQFGELRDCGGAVCRRGPDVSVTLLPEGTCPTSVVRAKVSGGDERNVEYADFVVGRRHFPHTTAPFEQVVPRETFLVRMRTLVVLNDGRRLTLDRDIPPCVATQR